MLVPRRVLIYHSFLWVVTASIVLLSCLQFGGDQNLSGYPPNRSTIYSEVSGRNFIKPPRPHKRTTMKRKIVSKKALAPIEIKASKRRLFQNGQPKCFYMSNAFFSRAQWAWEKPDKTIVFHFCVPKDLLKKICSQSKFLVSRWMHLHPLKIPQLLLVGDFSFSRGAVAGVTSNYLGVLSSF